MPADPLAGELARGLRVPGTARTKVRLSPTFGPRKSARNGDEPARPNTEMAPPRGPRRSPATRPLADASPGCDNRAMSAGRRNCHIPTRPSTQPEDDPMTYR